MIVTIGTNDTLASSGAQLDYFQSVVDRMGRTTVEQFARFFVMPQTGHGLSGTSHAVNGEGKTIPSLPIPNRYDQLGLLFDWVENKVAPGMSVTVTADDRSLPSVRLRRIPATEAVARAQPARTSARRR